MLTWLKERRRQKIREGPFPHAWRAFLMESMPHCRDLSAEERRKLERDTLVLLEEKWWEGCRGLELTDEIRVTIAAQACLLVLALPHDFYPNVQTILVYPTRYYVPVEEHGPGGVVTSGVSGRLGEAWHSGPVVLSWSDAAHGARDPDDGHNVVFHEFAHKLDMLDGNADGTPPLPTRAELAGWAKACEQAFLALKADAAAGTDTLLDTYGATNEAEFFAVATEHFFDRPRSLVKHLPELYRVLASFYRQDPAARDA